MKLLLITGPPLLNLRVVAPVGDKWFLCSDLHDISCSSLSRSLSGKAGVLWCDIHEQLAFFFCLFVSRASETSRLLGIEEFIALQTEQIVKL